MMGCRVSSWNLFLHLLVLLLAHVTEAREMISIDHLGHHHHHDPTSSPAINFPSDVSSTYFFNINEMKAGKRLAIYFLKAPASSARFLPREKADSIPFSLQHLPYLLKLFSFPQASSQALAMENTLRKCDSEPIKGEDWFCATSLESMLDFVRVKFGISEPNSHGRAILLTSTLLSKDEKAVNQNYTALKSPEEVLASKMIACHVMPYPYVIFYCHSQKGGNKVYKIPFIGDNGDELKAFSVCHEDTSEWDPDHVSFRKLGTKPGSRVCHFFPPHDHFIWVNTPTTSSI